MENKLKKTEIGILFGVSILLMFFLPQNVESLPPPMSDAIERHRAYVDSIISMQEKPPIKEQMKNLIPAYNVMCNNDFMLLLKWTSDRSACVSPQTAEKLVERNWGVYRKDVHDVGYGEDPYTYFVGGGTTISFKYDVSKYDETKLFKKIRIKLSEYLKELGWSADYNWVQMSIVKESEGHFKLGVVGGMREDLLRTPLERIEGVSEIEYLGQQV